MKKQIKLNVYVCGSDDMDCEEKYKVRRKTNGAEFLSPSNEWSEEGCLMR